MTEFLSAALSFPTVIFTVLLALAVLYWGLVIIGGIGVDALDGLDGAADGAAEGALEGVVEGAVEGAAEGAAEGIVEAAVEGVAEGAAEAAAEGAAEGVMDGGGGDGLLGTLLGFVHVKGVPLSLVLTLVFVYGWLVTHVVTLFVLQGAGFDSGLLRGALLVAAFLISVPLANRSVRPLARVTESGVAMTSKDLIGKTVRIDTSRVDARFGTATFDDGSGGMILHVRCDADNNGLKRGSQALILSWDEKRDAFEVTSLEGLVPSRKDNANA